MARRQRRSGKHCASWRTLTGFAQPRETEASRHNHGPMALAVTTGWNHNQHRPHRKRSVMNMNEVVVINNQGELFGMYERPSHGNAVLPSRSSSFMDQIFRFADVTVDVGRRKITRDGEVVPVTPVEHNLLLYFLHNVDRALARDAI